MTIVHRTYTPFDMRAITITGLSVKPEGDKRPAIGKFGTGLKYAIAVLIRNGCSVTIMTPGERHKIVPEAGEFRGQAYEGLLMRSWPTNADAGKSRRPKRTQLPFTTHYGSNWEMWMAFRELHSNTLDEGGFTERFPNGVPEEHQQVGYGCAILIEGEAYEQEFFRKGQTFLDAGPKTRLVIGGVKIYDLPHPDYANEFKYYRGLRAGQMHDNTVSLFIYDCVDEVYLTEERQVNDYYWDWRVATAIASCDDEELIKAVIEAEDGTWEHQLTFHPSMTPSETFMRIAAIAKVPARHYDFIKAHKPESIKQLDLDLYPTPWHVVSYGILAGNDNVVARRPDNLSEVDFRAVWTDRVEAINTYAPTLKAEEPSEAGAAPVDGAEGGEDVVFLTEEVTYEHTEDTCPGHVASEGDAKVCGRCGIHINSLRPDPEDDIPF